MNLSKTIKDDLLPKLRERYACRQRVGKTRMLDALCENYGYDRKSVSKLLGDACRSGSAHRGVFRRPQTT